VPEFFGAGGFWVELSGSVRSEARQKKERKKGQLSSPSNRKRRWPSAAKSSRMKCGESKKEEGRVEEKSQEISCKVLSLARKRKISRFARRTNTKCFYKRRA